MNTLTTQGATGHVLTHATGIFSSFSKEKSCQQPTGLDQYEPFTRGFLTELTASAGKIREYLSFKQKLDEEDAAAAVHQALMSLEERHRVRKEREMRITRFIESLTSNQSTVLYLLFQAGSVVLSDAVGGRDSIYPILYQYVDADFNFTHTNNRQFKLSYFHDYLFTRKDAGMNVLAALNRLDAKM